MGHASFWRNFAMRSPRPASLRCVMGDDVQEIDISNTTQTFVQIANTLDALNPDRVDALSEDGTILRSEKRRSPRNPVDVPSVLHEDPETARFIVMNDLLARAWQQSSEVAFNRLSDFVQMLMDRDRAAERRIERLEQQRNESQRESLEAQLRAHLAANGADEGMLDELIRAFMGGGMGAGPFSKPEGDDDEPGAPEDEPVAEGGESNG